jgi:hypothetical protein
LYSSAVVIAPIFSGISGVDSQRQAAGLAAGAQSSGFRKGYHPALPRPDTTGMSCIATEANVTSKYNDEKLNGIVYEQI